MNFDTEASWFKKGHESRDAEIEHLRQQLAEKDQTILDHVEIQNALREQLASRDAEVAALRITLVESESISRLGYSLSAKQLIRADRLAKQVKMLRDVVWETNKYLDQTYADLIGNLGAEWLAARIVDHLSPILSKALAATEPTK